MRGAWDLLMSAHVTLMYAGLMVGYGMAQWVTSWF